MSSDATLFEEGMKRAQHSILRKRWDCITFSLYVVMNAADSMDGCRTPGAASWLCSVSKAAAARVQTNSRLTVAGRRRRPDRGSRSVPQDLWVREAAAEWRMRALKFCRSEGVLTQEGRPTVEGMTPTMPQDCSECEAECGKSATQQRSCRSLRLSRGVLYPVKQPAKAGAEAAERRSKDVGI